MLQTKVHKVWKANFMSPIHSQYIKFSGVCVWGITFGVISKSENKSLSHTWNSDLHGLYPNRASQFQIWSYDQKHWYGMSYSRHVFPIHLWATGMYTMCRFSHRLHSANTAQHIAKMSSLTSFEAQMFPITQVLFSTVQWKLTEASITTTYVLKLLVQHRLLKLKISFRRNYNNIHILQKRHF